ncbi:MAG TPA: HDOD domain-containing protein [Bryobacteraceae bacterium]|nr:HDOD domain-containing protein [Bryobacteraceae bacterium]
MSSLLKTTEVERPWALSTPPPFPAIAMKVLEVLGNEEVDVRMVVRWLQADPVFSGEMLRVANSALYATSGEIRSVHHATITLGLDFVKALAITVGLRAYVKSAMKLPILRRCWTHSLACAMLSQEIASACFMKGDEAYTAGLLHDIGRLGLLAAYPREYANVLGVAVDYSFDVLHCERDLFDIDHCEAGAWLAEQWKLPPELAAIAAHHHEEPAVRDPEERPSLLTIVRLGCRLADTLDFAVVTSRNTWTLDQVTDQIPEAARLRFPKDVEALKCKVADRSHVLV